MNHGEIIREIQDRSDALGLLSHYCRNGRSCDGAGLPDVIVAGPYGAAWIEAKAGHDTLKPAQTAWKHTLTAAGHRHYVIREADFATGRLGSILDSLAGPQREEMDDS